MANNVMDLELEDFTYDDDGLPVPLPANPRPASSLSSSANNNNNNNINGHHTSNSSGSTGRRKHRKNRDEMSGSDHQLITADSKTKSKHRTHGNRRYQDHSPINDTFNTSSSTLPDVETVRIDSEPVRKSHESRETVVRSQPLDDGSEDEIACITLPAENGSHKFKKHSPGKKHSPKLSKRQDNDCSPAPPHEYSPVIDKRPPLRPHKYTAVEEEWEGNLQAMFDVDGEGFDVMLTATKLTLSPMSSGYNRRKNKRRGSGMFRSASRASLSKGSSLNINSAGDEVIRLKDVYGAKVRRKPSPNHVNQASGEGICVGLTVLTFLRKDANKLKLRNICLDHPSESLSLQWVSRINAALKAFTNRPKRVKVILQPHAGTKLGAGLYKSHIIPIFQAAGIEGDLLEVKYNEHIKQEMIHMDVTGYDCLVCIGGDGTVRQVMSGLLTSTQEKHSVPMKKGFSPAQATVPLAIIATGTTNHIAYSVMGTEDPITGALHAVLGHSQPVDVCTVYGEEKLLTWVFNSQYGFAANVLEFADRYKALGPKRIDAAFLKAMTKAKLRPYECDIEYIPSPTLGTSHSNDGMVCVRGCTVCRTDKDSCSVSSDLVEDYDPLANSSTSSTFRDLTEESPWRHCKGEYYNVGVFAVPGRSSFAPQGLSKFTHLADGCMDLVLVKNTDRKEFVRYLKRHAGSKNQLDLPFVETHRVKEVRFRPRLPITWNYKDYNFSEIDYEMGKVQKRLDKKTKSMNEISLADDSEDEDSDSEDEDSSCDMRTGSQNVTPRDDTEDNNSEAESNQGNNNNRRKSSATRKQSTTSAQQGVTPNPHRYRMTFTEREILRRRNKQAKKDEKKKAKEQTKMRSRWNFDNEVFNDGLEIDIRVHQGLLRVCGQGVSPDTEPEETKMSCLPAIVL